MAYQPKSYRKFLAGTVSAAVVASAIAPVASASFTDVAGSVHADDIATLVAKGYIKGYSDGTFKPNQSLTRGEAAIIFSRILKDAGVTEKGAGFPDVPASKAELAEAVAIVQAAGIMTGDEKGNFNPNANITREQMAKVVVEAFKLTKPANYTTKVTDLDKAGAWAREYIQVLEANGVTKNTEFMPKQNVTRGQFASFVVRAMNVGVTVVTPEVESVSAIGSKKLEVKFNKAVDDTKAKFEVKKGSITSSIAKVTFAQDKKSAVIELAGKLSKGEYTVNVTGVSEETLSTKVNVEDEKVAKIELLSDAAVASTINNSGNVTEVEVAYRVYNQYGEDVTKTTPLVATAGIVTTNGAQDVVASNGTLTISNLTNSKLGDKFAVSLVHAETAVSATATVTISNKSTVSEVAIGGLYNADNETLTEDSTASDFMLLVNAKDQYGNDITDAGKVKDDLIVTVSDQTVASVNSYSNGTATFEKVKINGKDQVVLKLANGVSGNLKAGKTTVTLISKTTGKSASFEVTVGHGVKVDTINFTAPDGIVAANEAVRIPFEALDLDGKAVNKASILNDTSTPANVRGVKVTATGAGLNRAVTFSQDYVTGKSYLEVTPTQEGKLTLTAITATNKVATITIDVKKEAVPTTLIGFDDDVATNALLHEVFVLSSTNFKVQDQYGRVMSDSKFVAKLGTDNGKYRIVVTEADAPTQTDGHGGAFKLSGTVIDNTTSSVTFTAGARKGTETITFKLEKNDNGTWKNVTGSEYELNARAVELNEIKSYDVADLTQMFDEKGYNAELVNDDKYDQTFKVYGVLSDGSKVIMPANPSDDAKTAFNNSNLEYYTVTTNDESVLSVVDDTDANKSLLDVIAAASYATNTTEKEFQVKVTINHTGDVITKTVKVSKEKPQVVGIQFDDTTDPDTLTHGKVEDSIEKGAVYELPAATLNAGTAAAVLPVVKVIDQYGKSTFVDASGVVTFTTGVTTNVTSVTFSNIVDEDKGKEIVITNNGKVNAKIAGLEALDNFTTTFTFANGKTAELKVVVTE
ncbi:S-layer homology domain-containing protein [Anoxybacillus flavithermus]|uniref:S-layer protein n=1 Tax=Anoxybacillus flavithermus AK1 TaxID=1297581 RepID=M8DLV6_9BACL|nr:S-layer homology domain-containing protein [Anoxybacillus flavithermus]EMT45410.1 S-layer protein [Anoxybacillus flavithermus AK1]